jgi:hypothetical protein
MRLGRQQFHSRENLASYRGRAAGVVFGNIVPKSGQIADRSP